MIAWMVYAAVVGGFVAAGGLALERLLATAGKPRRIAWMAALALAVVIPLAGSLRQPRASVDAAGAAVVENNPDGAPVADRRSFVPTLRLPASRESERAAAIVWGAGSLTAMAVLGTVLFLVARARRRWPLGRIHDTDVHVSRRFGPALVGVAKPRVVVPSWVLRLGPGARGAIVRHELEHARARDHLALLYAGLVLVVFPWSPAIWWMCRRLRAAVELDCDQRVIASGIRAADYGDVLLEAGSRSIGRWGFAPAMSQPKSLLERRLRTMSETRKKLGATKTLLLGGVVGVALVAACDTQIPTDVQDAIVDAMVDENGQAVDAQTEATAKELFRFRTYRLNLKNPPIIYLDGVRIDGFDDLEVNDEPDERVSVTGTLQVRSLGTLDPDAIERVEVLKGAAATALYGSEAEGGVIQIFTRRDTLQMSMEMLQPSGALTADARAEAVRRAERIIATGTDLPRGNIRIVGTEKLVPPAKRRN